MTERACNKCGQCCHQQPCFVGLYDVKGAEDNKPCPALERDGDDYLCGVLTHPFDVIDWNWLGINPEASEQRAKVAYIEVLQRVIRSSMTRICDSHYGNGSDDMRIPVHIMKDHNYGL